MTRHRAQTPWDAIRHLYPADMSPQMEAVLREAHNTVERYDTARERVTPTHSGPRYGQNYMPHITRRILDAIDTDEALTREEIAARAGYSPKYIAKALTHLVATGQLHRNHARPGVTSRYWRPQ